ncbi:hypothetical protein SOASR015_35760 [Pectobacterium carotovorum subsp. carotovorum]|nr:hypothetical protein SOASR015_35760 [Pectobacterium carotovorum subsp. carotovorum]GLX58397.1 hypothetical protein Pcaca02_37060 [Pectobacterium carotovorum subsp. carotovorum]
MKSILFLIFFVLSSSSIADDKKSDANDIPQQTVSVSTQSNVDAFNHFDDEKNLAKLAEKISSSKEKRDALEILEKVDSFYSKSFYNLLLLVIAMIGLVGGVIPLGISYYQSKSFKSQVAKSQEDIENNFSQKLEELKGKLASENEEKMAGLERKIELMLNDIEKKTNDDVVKVKYQSLGLIFHTLAATCSYGESYRSASGHLLTAGFYYMNCGDEANLRNVINELTKSTLAKTPKDKDMTILKGRYNKFINKMKNYEKRNEYSDEVMKLKLLWESFSAK